MKFMMTLILCLPMLAFAADHGGEPAETKAPAEAAATDTEHGGEPAEAAADDEQPAAAHEHGGEPAEAKP